MGLNHELVSVVLDTGYQEVGQTRLQPWMEVYFWLLNDDDPLPSSEGLDHQGQHLTNPKTDILETNLLPSGASAVQDERQHRAGVTDLTLNAHYVRDLQDLQ